MTTSDVCLPPIPSDIAFITGPTMLGICLNWGFMGVLIVQIYFYHNNFSEDKMLIKWLVYGLAILDVAQTALVTADAFHWFVFGFGNLAQLDTTFLNSWDVPLLDAFIALIVQSFYSWRIYVLTSAYIFPILIVAVSLCQFGAGVGVTVRAADLGHWSLIGTDVVAQTIWLVGSAVADILITLVLTWTLLRSRSKVLPSSRGMINKIVYMTAETNLVTAIVAVIAIIIFLGVPQHPTLVVPPTAIMGKLYTNCLIALFNNRRTDSGFSTRISASDHLQGLSTNDRSSYRVQEGAPSNRREGLQIQVMRNIHLKNDSDIQLNSLQKVNRDGDVLAV